MFEASLKTKRIGRGQTVEGTVVAIGPAVAFVDVGGKGEAMIDIAELKDDDGALEVAVGDRIQAMVTSTEGGLTLSRRLARGSATNRQLEDAYQSGLAVEGKVVQEVKGGFEVRIGKQRAFCPMSQIDIVRTTNAAEHVGRVYTFRITEYKEGGRNLIVSRRVLLEDERRADAVAIRKAIVPGAIVTGHVASVRDFGAFVDLGAGVQGLLHVSEIGWSRVSDPANLLKAGEAITVKVLRVDEDKIALGLKQLTADPWTTVQDNYAVGQVRTGKVTRQTEFGAFVELEPGLEGLAHVSTFAPTGHSKGWAKAAPVGTTAAFEILTIDVEKKRIGLALVPEGTSRAATAVVQSGIVAGARVTGKIERHEKFGVFVFLAPGRTALMPFSETGLAKEADAAKALPIGSDIEVVVLEADAAGRRIRVSRKAINDAREADEVREYSERSDVAAPASLGSLADKLRNALKR